MKIACAFDHAGFPLKALVIETVSAEGHEIVDLGTWSTDPVDYPDVSAAALRDKHGSGAVAAKIQAHIIMAVA